MKKIAFVIPVILMVACQDPSTEDTSSKTGNSLETHDDSLAYGIGINIGRNLISGDLGRLDPQKIAQGLADILDSSEALLNDQQINAMLMAEQMKEQEKRQAEAMENKKAGDAWLVENALKDGVEITKSGLQYKILEQGTGTVPTPDGRVRVHYTGTLIDGTKFDSSYDDGVPAEFNVNGVIRGWTEALTMMPVGSRWQLFIPSELGYGMQVAPGGEIPPNSVLIFELELLEILR